MRVWRHGFVARAAGEDTGEPGSAIPFVAANEGRMADGIDLRMETADLGRYAGNPVVGYGHDFWGREALPIGRAPGTRIEGTQLLADIEFDLDDPFAATVDRKVRGGFLNAVSIGFDAYDIGTDGVPARWELFEISVVPLPMDPGATASIGHAAGAGRTLALARSLAGLRARRGLPAEHLDLIDGAVANLLTVLGAAADAVDDVPADVDPARGRGPALPPAPPTGTRLDAARRRLFASGL